MEIAMIGLGRMGGNMSQRLLRAGHKVVAYDRSQPAVAELEGAGATGARALEELTAKLAPPRNVWLMVPAGAPTEATLASLLDILEPDDTVIDGGNSNYRDSLRRAAMLRERGLNFVDCGTSGGIWGLSEGYCLMIGGQKEPVERLRPVFESLAPAAARGWAHVGPPGAGHFVKMVHNGIEYGLMQAYAEGFDILKAKTEFQIDLAKVAEVWRHGSVVRSWLLDLTADALAEDPTLADLAPWVEDSGEGRWTVDEAVDLAVPAPVISMSLMMRFASRQENSFAARLLAAMRNKFGGHPVKKAPA
jgi:6-phosphogluconate dehydrogenase